MAQEDANKKVGLVLPAAFVVLVLIGVAQYARGGAASESEAAVESEIESTEPALSPARILKASWRTAHDFDEPEDGEDPDADGGVDWSEFNGRNGDRRERALREVIGKTGGLAIHVESGGGDKNDR